MLFGVIMFSSACTNTSKITDKTLLSKTPFGVCYSKVSPDQVRSYELVIVEPDFYTKTEVEALKKTGTTILAYITLGETDSNRWYYPLLEQQGFIGINENWGSAYLDLENEEVRSILLEKMLPEVMIKGFDGLFLDTIDAVAPYTERRGLRSHMVDLIKEIRVHFPDKIIIQNAGLFLLEETRSSIDAVLIEDIASGYDFENQRYYIKNLEEFNERLNLVRNTAIEFNIPIFIVDFAETKADIFEVRSRLDTLNVPYFISNIQLSKLPGKAETVANKVRRN